MPSFAPWTSSLVSSLRSVPFRSKFGGMYAGMLLAAGALLLVIRAQGERLLAPALPLLESGRAAASRAAAGATAGGSAAGGSAEPHVQNVLLHVL
ncbi:MAG: hypothetical protein ABI895_00550, partial [Deltaproteobacteria bacterium]